MSRNPFRHDWFTDTEQRARLTAGRWRVYVENHLNEAARFRWAARHACRRLRQERDTARRALESVLADDRRWAAWARELGANYCDLREVLWPYQEGDASFGWVVERIRDLVRAAAQHEKERADRAEVERDSARILHEQARDGCKRLVTRMQEVYDLRNTLVREAERVEADRARDLHRVVARLDAILSEGDG